MSVRMSVCPSEQMFELNLGVEQGNNKIPLTPTFQKRQKPPICEMRVYLKSTSFHSQR